jgi:endonuclease/exonuclease/phosphatase family metal-dependent hydrolase
MNKILLILFLASILFAQERILIDENFSDWNNINTFYEDPIGDNQYGEFDFQTMRITNDEEYLYLSIQTTEEINLVSNNFIALLIDTDNNVSTGKLSGGIGAELEYIFGMRQGKSYLPDENIVDHSDIGFIGSPTFTSDEFEFAIKRKSYLSGLPLFTNDTIKLKFISYTSISFSDYYDQSPDTSGYEYVFKESESDLLPAYSIEKEDSNYLRMLAYNIERDGIIETGNTTEFGHIFGAIKPEIIGFTEIYEHTSEKVADRMEFFLPSGEGEAWYHEKEGEYDIVLLSRYPIKESFTIESEASHDASGAFLLDLRPKHDTDILVIVAHPKCCGGTEEDEKRQNQFDAIISFLREAVTPGGILTIQDNIPIVIMGDMNLVGDSRQYETLITGDIEYNDIYGDDFIPDWDGSDLDDAIPFVTNTGMTYTTNPRSFPPGRLDFLVYTGSVMTKINSYVFDTSRLTDDQLAEYGLVEEDTKVSDHLPVVVDFDITPITDVKKKDNTPEKLRLLQNFPNPFNPVTTIKYSVPDIGKSETLPAGRQELKGRNVSLKIFDLLGREIATLVNEKQRPGNYEVEFSSQSGSVQNLTSGIYFYTIRVNNFFATKKMILLK